MHQNISVNYIHYLWHQNLSAHSIKIRTEYPVKLKNMEDQVLSCDSLRYPTNKRKEMGGQEWSNQARKLKHPSFFSLHTTRFASKVHLTWYMQNNT